MKLHATVDPSTLAGARCLAESGEFALYVLDRDSYMLVQKHESVSWCGISVSGDGVFRMGVLLANAMRDLYRDVASDVNARRAERSETVTPLRARR